MSHPDQAWSGLGGSLATGLKFAALTYALAYVAPLPLLGAALVATRTGAALSLASGIYFGTTHRSRRIRRRAEREAAGRVLASNDDPAVEALLRSLRQDFLAQHAQPSLVGVGEPVHAVLDLAWAAARGPAGAGGAAGVLSLVARNVSPALSYLGSRLLGAGWANWREGSGRPTTSAVRLRLARQVRVDGFAATRAGALAAHPLEAMVADGFLDLVSIDELFSDVEGLGPTFPTGVHRSALAALNQLWQAASVLASASDAFAEAEFRERLARALGHVICSASFLAPYAMLAKAPHHLVVSASDLTTRGLGRIGIRIPSRQLTLLQFQAISGVLSTILIALVDLALEATDLARHRYVMRRLAEMGRAAAMGSGTSPTVGTT